MRCVVVSHTHWDREWYRTFEGFRSRLLDAVDRLLELLDEDPGFRFLLDGQTSMLEDYLELRPERRLALERACREKRVEIGPWYVQPDSLLPDGEAHVRNLLEGRRVGTELGGVSTVAYTPDSFGHPAQLPQILAGFALEPFVYWRGNGDEIDSLPAEYVWRAPDGSEVLAHHLSEGYFAAAGLPGDAMAGALFLRSLASKLGERTRSGVVLLLNGIDHAMPDGRVRAAVEALERITGWKVERGLLEDFAGALPRQGPRFEGELLGARVANLLPGVWSARLPLKLRNRRAEAALLGWAEPFSALGAALGAVGDERPALRRAWRELLRNQAHDSLGGCSIDAVHAQMQARYDAAEELADETTKRCLERLAGRGTERATPWSASQEVVVFNPSPRARTDVVRVELEPDCWLGFRGELRREMAVHSLLGLSAEAAGFEVDGRPAHDLVSGRGRRVQLAEEHPPRTVEFVARDVPALGCRRYRLTAGPAASVAEDEGRELRMGACALRVASDGTLELELGARCWSGLLGIEDEGDRGDSYDFDPVAGDGARVLEVGVRRRRHPAGIGWLEIDRVLELPVGLEADRKRRAAERVRMLLRVVARLAEGVSRVDVRVEVDNRARDHRLRLLFPTGGPLEAFEAATTFDVAVRRPGPRRASGWQQASPATFPHQGFVAAGGLMVGAPGLPEAEVRPDGVIALTLLRSVGWLARHDLRTRPLPAGPMIPAPGAQCLGRLEARLALAAADDAAVAREAELGLRAVLGGDRPILEPGRPLVEVEPSGVLVTALKPAESSEAVVLRLLNPTGEEIRARVRLGLRLRGARLVRLDETADGGAIELDAAAREVGLSVPAHALRTLELQLGR